MNNLFIIVITAVAVAFILPIVLATVVVGLLVLYSSTNKRQEMDALNVTILYVATFSILLVLVGVSRGNTSAWFVLPPTLLGAWCTYDLIHRSAATPRKNRDQHIVPEPITTQIPVQPEPKTTQLPVQTDTDTRDFPEQTVAVASVWRRKSNPEFQVRVTGANTETILWEAVDRKPNQARSGHRQVKRWNADYELVTPAPTDSLDSEA